MSMSALVADHGGFIFGSLRYECESTMPQAPLCMIGVITATGYDNYSLSFSIPTTARAVAPTMIEIWFPNDIILRITCLQLQGWIHIGAESTKNGLLNLVHELYCKVLFNLR